MRLNFPHHPRKRFGQNFLRDPQVIHHIIDAIHPEKEDRIIEIGPGQGILTKSLLEVVDHLEVIEIDRDLAVQLNLNYAHTHQLTVHTNDVLQVDFNAFIAEPKNTRKLRVIGNLPYNISTPLIFHLLSFSPLLLDMHFMLQKEVADRLVAAPNQKQYGRLSIMAQYYCHIEPLFLVPPNAFYPSPKVQSTFVRLIPHQSIPHPALNHSLFQEVTRTAFNQRRKTLGNALKIYLNIEDFAALKITPTLRPETLSVADFVRISNYIHGHPKLSSLEST